MPTVNGSDVIFYITWDLPVDIWLRVLSPHPNKHIILSLLDTKLGSFGPSSQISGPFGGRDLHTSVPSRLLHLTFDLYFLQIES